MLIRTNLIHKPTDGFVCNTPSRTQQQFKDECDVNNILRNYVNTGILTHTAATPPQFGDYSEMPTDYGEALALIERSREEFAGLPSEVRKRFDNNPLRLVQFLQDSNNREEAEKLGLVHRKTLESTQDSVADSSD